MVQPTFPFPVHSRRSWLPHAHCFSFRTQLKELPFMNTRHLLLAFFGTMSLALSGCAGDARNDTPAASSSTTATPSSSATATSSVLTTTTSSETTPEATTLLETGTIATAELVTPPTPSAASQPVAAPTFVECIYGGGSWTSQALMSDGSYQWSAECQQKLDEQRAKAPYQCPQTDYFVPDPWYCDNQLVPWSVPHPPRWRPRPISSPTPRRS